VLTGAAVVGVAEGVGEFRTMVYVDVTDGVGVLVGLAEGVADGVLVWVTVAVKVGVEPVTSW
jgi:hypothetical protein